MAMTALNETIAFVASQLKGNQYCLRGTCSLILQNIDMNVDDIDILCNENTALLVNDLFKEYVINPVSYKESDKYKSYFGKFKINDIDIEFMGNWQIKHKDETWSETFDGSSFNAVNVNGTIVKVSKVEDELKMFLLMGRFNAYQKIKKQLPSEPKEINSAQLGLF